MAKVKNLTDWNARLIDCGCCGYPLCARPEIQFQSYDFRGGVAGFLKPKESSDESMSQRYLKKIETTTADGVYTEQSIKPDGGEYTSYRATSSFRQVFKRVYSQGWTAAKYGQYEEVCASAGFEITETCEVAGSASIIFTAHYRTGSNTWGTGVVGSITYSLEDLSGDFNLETSESADVYPPCSVKVTRTVTSYRIQNNSNGTQSIVRDPSGDSTTEFLGIPQGMPLLNLKTEIKYEDPVSRDAAFASARAWISSNLNFENCESSGQESGASQNCCPKVNFPARREVFFPDGTNPFFIETIFRYRIQLPAADSLSLYPHLDFHLGSYYRLEWIQLQATHAWDAWFPGTAATEPEPKPIITDKAWTWTGGERTSPWSPVIRMPGAAEGVIYLASPRHQCYRAPAAPRLFENINLFGFLDYDPADSSVSA